MLGLGAGNIPQQGMPQGHSACKREWVARHACRVAASPILGPAIRLTTNCLLHAQDYRIHHEEVCTKLVAIMRERLSANIKQLPALAAGWPAGGAAAADDAPAPSAFAATAARQLGILSGALAPLLLPEELHSIFGRIGLMFSRTLAEAYELLEPHGEAWEQQLRADMQVGGVGGAGMLQCANPGRGNATVCGPGAWKCCSGRARGVGMLQLVWSRSDAPAAAALPAHTHLPLLPRPRTRSSPCTSGLPLDMSRALTPASPARAVPAELPAPAAHGSSREGQQPGGPHPAL